MSDAPTLKPVRWVGSSKKNLLAMPGEVRRVFGFALLLAQPGSKHRQAKPLKGCGSAGVLEVVEDWHGDTYRAVYTVKFADVVYILHCFQKKAKKGVATPKATLDLIASRLAEAEVKDRDAMIEEGSTNVYADLGFPDADEMLVKARLAAWIGEIIKSRRLTQTEAARIIGLSQPKLSGLLRGQFRGISEAKMLLCLTRLGRDVKIVIGAPRRRAGAGHIEVLAA